MYCLSSGGWKSKIKVLAVLVSSEAVREDLLQASRLALGGLLAILGFSQLVEASL